MRPTRRTGSTRSRARMARQPNMRRFSPCCFSMSARVILALIVAATVCRCLLVVLLLAWPTMADPNPVRFTGALGTYPCGAAPCIALFA